MSSSLVCGWFRVQLLANKAPGEIQAMTMVVRVSGAHGKSVVFGLMAAFGTPPHCNTLEHNVNALVLVSSMPATRAPRTPRTVMGPPPGRQPTNSRTFAGNITDATTLSAVA
jgi:hypothetical protein